MNDAVVEAFKLVGYRASGIEGKITLGVPDPIVYLDRALELLNDYEKVGRNYDISFNTLSAEMNGFIKIMIEKYHPDIDYDLAIKNASAAVFSMYAELLKLKKPIRLT